MGSDAPRRVLVVDDDPDYARVCVTALDDDPDLRPVTATSADEARSTLRESAVDCLVSDSIRTDDGESLIEVVARTRPDLPILLCSGRSPADLPTDVVDGYVEKGAASDTTCVERVREQVRSLTLVDADPGGWESLGTFDWTGAERVDLAVLEALADRTGFDPLSRPLFADAVDPDALHRFVTHAARAGDDDAEVRVRFDGYLIAVTADGTVRYRELPDDGPAPASP